MHSTIVWSCCYPCTTYLATLLASVLQPSSLSILLCYHCSGTLSLYHYSPVFQLSMHCSCICFIYYSIVNKHLIRGSSHLTFLLLVFFSSSSSWFFLMQPEKYQNIFKLGNLRLAHHEHMCELHFYIFLNKLVEPWNHFKK